MGYSDEVKMKPYYQDSHVTIYHGVDSDESATYNGQQLIASRLTNPKIASACCVFAHSCSRLAKQHAEVFRLSNMLTPKERTRRYRARKRGEAVEVIKPGPKPGYKQSADHVSKRKRFGEDHSNWAGDGISIKGGRSRAIRLFPEIGSCSICGNERSERHHIDGNTANNDIANIAILCRRCHMEADGRLAKFAVMNGRSKVNE